MPLIRGLATSFDIADSDEFDFGSFLIAVGTSVLLLAIASRFIGRGEEKREEPAR